MKLLRDRGADRDADARGAAADGRGERDDQRRRSSPCSSAVTVTAPVLARMLSSMNASTLVRIVFAAYAPAPLIAMPAVPAIASASEAAAEIAWIARGLASPRS